MRYFLSLSLLVLAFIANARQITPDEAQAAAQDFFNNSSVEQSRAPRAVRARALNTNQNEENAPYYVFNASDDKGFVIISGDDRAKKILGYSDKGNFDVTNMPPQLSSMLDQFAESLTKLSGSTADQSWTAPTRAASPNDGVLLETANWGQGYPYNKHCPEIDGVKSPTGCLATAMAIIMKYHNWPEKGRGISRWMGPSDMIEYNFDDSSFDFPHMLNNYSNGNYNNLEANAVAELMYAASACVRMRFGANESSAHPCLAGHYFNENLYYSPDCQYIYSGNFAAEKWFSMIKEQLDNNLPILYSDHIEGHTFVCDGYTNDGYIHANWGWDGEMNGYFLPPINMLGTYNHQSMVINIKPTDDTQLYSRCWNDKGYLNSIYISGGTGISVPDIRPGEKFNIAAGRITYPCDFGGKLSMAIINSKNEILQIIKDKNDNNIEFEIESESIPDFRNYGYIEIKDGHFDIPIDESYRLSIVSKENSDSEWRIVLGTIEAPSSISVTGNAPCVSTINWNFHGDTSMIECSNETFKDYNIVVKNSYFPVLVKARGGVAYVCVDGIYRSNCSDCSLCDMGFIASNGEHIIDIFYNTYDNLIERSYSIDKNTNLNLLVPDNEKPLINKLTLKGELTYQSYCDIFTLFPSLQHLDISKATIEDNILLPLPDNFYQPEDGIERTFQGLVSFKLPETLREIARYAVMHRALDYIEIPSSVIKIESHAIVSNGFGHLDFISVRNPEPVAAIPDDINNEPISFIEPFPEWRQFVTLIVPVGSKTKYYNHPDWQGFREILESDIASDARYINHNGLTYLLIHDFAVISCTDGSPYCVISNNVERNGKIFPVNYTTRAFEIPTEPWTVLFFESTNPIISDSGINGFFVTPCLDLYNQAGLAGGYVPGGFIVESRPDAPSSMFIEMWCYKIDHINKLLQISNAYHDNISIDEIRINGESIQFEPSGIYDISNFESLDVQITFTYWDHETYWLDKEERAWSHTMTTHYTAEFNNSLPNSDLSGIYDVVSDKELIFDVYSTMGILVRKGCNKQDLQHLRKGIYILKGVSSASKIMIK